MASFLLAEKPILSQTLSRGEVFHPSDDFCGSFLSSFQSKRSMSFLCQEAQRWMQYSRSHQTRITSLDHPARLLMQAWFSRFEEHTAVSSPIFHSPVPSDLPAQGIISIHSSSMLYSCQGLSQPTGNTPRTLDLALLNLVPTEPLTSPSKVPWKSAGDATSHCLCHNEGN